MTIEVSSQATRVREYWEDPETVSLRDENLRILESRAILSALPPNLRVLDVGCGDGVNTVEYARKSAVVVGIDYSMSMIRKALGRLRRTPVENCTFLQTSLDALPFSKGFFDTVITQRCLINLENREAQRKAIAGISGLLRPGGFYLMLETVQEGLEEVNRIRAGVELEPLKTPWHNLYFNREVLEESLKEFFVIREIRNFGLYYLLTRIFEPMTGLVLTDPLIRRMDHCARRLEETIDPERFMGIGPQSLYILEKK